jgi:hypothetical protein
MTQPKNTADKGGTKGKNATSNPKNKVDPIQRAHQQADADIANDLETSAHSPNDDLDEGELARLGENGGPME